MESNAEVRTLEDISRCPICFDTLKDARFMPCGHTFCQLCIEQCKASVVGINCPMCRTNSVVSLLGQISAGCSDLPKNLVAQNLVDVVRDLKDKMNAGRAAEENKRGLVPSGAAGDKPTTRGSSRSWIYETIHCPWCCGAVCFLIVFPFWICALERQYKNFTSDENKLKFWTEASKMCEDLVQRISDPPEEEKAEDWFSQIGSSFRHIFQQIGLASKPEDVEKEDPWEELMRLLQQTTKQFCDGVERIRRRQEQTREQLMHGKNQTTNER